MNYRNIAVSACCALLFSALSCASFKPIDQIDGVVDVDWTLHEGQNSNAPDAALTELKSGQKYYISVKYLQKNDKGKESWKNLYNYDGITLSANNDDFAAAFPLFTAPADPFYIFKKEKNSMTVRFPKAIGKDVTKDVSITLSAALPSFKGAAGANGTDGDMSKIDGGDGGDGKDAANQDFEVARYNPKGTALESEGMLLLVNDINTKKVWILNARNSMISLDVSGGNGGIGGKGADTKIKKESNVNFIQGGKGGNGGDGGRGGFLHIITPPGSTLGNLFRPAVNGGKGGSGGKGGTGEKTELDNKVLNFLAGAVINGSDGKDGMKGPEGRYFTESKDFATMFLTVTSPFFERTRLEP